jgi:hypothetical protein
MPATCRKFIFKTYITSNHFLFRIIMYDGTTFFIVLIAQYIQYQAYVLYRLYST